MVNLIPNGSFTVGEVGEVPNGWEQLLLDEIKREYARWWEE